LDDTTMHNSENDEWFVALVQSGKLALSIEGVAFNPKTKRHIGAPMTNGYLKISWADPETKVIRNMLIHRLVWLVYKGPIPEGYEVNHKDFNKGNPRLSNLEILTKSGNSRHAMAAGRLYLFTSETGSAAAQKQWSGRLDSNQRSPAPEAGALPD
jgi:hypothetical protein